MGSLQGVCVVCGVSPTVRAHLFPRALMLDMRLGAPHLVSGHIDRKGVRFKQNGEWDDRTLCAEHEFKIGRGDEYGIEFCRNWAARASESEQGKALQIPNPAPDDLLHFAYGVVWRHSKSVAGAGRLRLGPAEAEMLEALLQRGPFRLKLLLGKNPIVIGHSPANLAVSPHRVRLAERNVVGFTVSGLDFYLKTDQRSWPVSWDEFLVNGNNPVTVSDLDPMPIQAIPKLRPIFRNMRTK